MGGGPSFGNPKKRIFLLENLSLFATVAGVMKYFFLLIALFLLAGCERNQAAAPLGSSQAEVGEEAHPDHAAAALEAEREAETRVALLIVTEAVKGFRVIEGRFPEDLQEVVDRGFMHSLPELPGEGRFSYDAKAGEVSVEEL